MRIYAHRGISDAYPENSESAIKEAFNRGFDVELDIRFTADKKIVIMHDSNLVRLCGINKNITELSSKEISKYPFFLSTTDETPFFLNELAVFLKRNKSYSNIAVHFKQKDQNHENCLIVSELFEKYNLYDNCFLFNLSLEMCTFFRRENPKMKIAVVVSDKKFEPFVYLFSEVKNRSDLFDIIWAAEYKKLYEAHFFSEVSELGKEIIAISPDLHRKLNHPDALNGYQKSWYKFFEHNISGVCTDHPSEFLQFLLSRRNYGNYL